MIATTEDAYRHLEESATRALETMFFAIPDRTSRQPARPTGKLVVAKLSFQGLPPGQFRLVVSEPLAIVLAANFLGSEDATLLFPVQVTGVIGELANIICGASLSKMESDANFDLSAPESIEVAAGEAHPDFTSGSPFTCRFEFPEGTLLAFLKFRELE